jgi:LytS/YehU family sensor histidine kinase
MQHTFPGLFGSFESGELVAGLVRITVGLALAVLVRRLAHRMPWPRPFRLWFALVHLWAALACCLAWTLLSSVAWGLLTGQMLLALASARWEEFFFLGSVLYAIIAGISYAMDATARAARAEAVAARTQLAALRAQLHPHFLFNALHTVVQLIPIDPARAAKAAELVAALLRTTIEEERDEITLSDEWSFVSRYLEMEHIRFGDRLRVSAWVDPALLDERVPSFALQTLVENAVQHGAAHRVGPTDVVVTASAVGRDFTLVVHNSGDGMPMFPSTRGASTGLARLRERLAALYGGAARLTYGARADGGFDAVLVIPLQRSIAP